MQPFNYDFQQQQPQRYTEPMQPYMGYGARTQPAPPVMQQNMRWIPVNGVEGARAHIVQPGVTAWLMDNNEPFFYVKSADSYGVTSFKTFRFEEVVNADTPKQGDFVSRSEFNEWTAKMEQFFKEVRTYGESVNGNDGQQF